MLQKTINLYTYEELNPAAKKLALAEWLKKNNYPPQEDSEAAFIQACEDNMYTFRKNGVMEM